MSKYKSKALFLGSQWRCYNFTPQKQNVNFSNRTREIKRFFNFFPIQLKIFFTKIVESSQVFAIYKSQRLFNLVGYYKTRRTLIQVLRKPAAIFQSLTGTSFEQYGDRATQ